MSYSATGAAARALFHGYVSNLIETDMVVVASEGLLTSPVTFAAKSIFNVVFKNGIKHSHKLLLSTDRNRRTIALFVLLLELVLCFIVFVFEVSHIFGGLNLFCKLGRIQLTT